MSEELTVSVTSISSTTSTPPAPQMPSPELDQQCAICQEKMSCPSFCSTLEQGQENDSFRLSCKHAFHSACVLLAFRTSCSTACPCCRNSGAPSSQVVTRGRYSLHITELEEDSEEETEVDMLEIMDNDPTLRSVRCTNQMVKTMRRELKETRKEYNVLRDELRRKRRTYISKALKEFRDQNREEYRKAKQKWHEKAVEVFELEKKSCIEMTSGEDYEAKTWKDLHEAECEEIQLKVTSGETRHTDPFNSSFWYA